MRHSWEMRSPCSPLGTTRSTPRRCCRSAHPELPRRGTPGSCTRGLLFGSPSLTAPLSCCRQPPALTLPPPARTRSALLQRRELGATPLPLQLGQADGAGDAPP
eukprot:6609398-Prymnesium_polylepis.1